jgi:CheY-like chemotaxis protein
MSSVSDLGPRHGVGLLGSLKAWLGASGHRAGPPGGVVAVHPPGSAPPFRAPLRVLVADDNPTNLIVAAAQLQSLGIVPLLAADGAEAAALACERAFDLILMDLQMPVLDGLGACAAIRRHESSSGRAAAPVLAYSSCSVGADLLAAHGISGSLSKPCSAQDLLNCLSAWCPDFRVAGKEPPDGPSGHVAWMFRGTPGFHQGHQAAQALGVRGQPGQHQPFKAVLGNQR